MRLLLVFLLLPTLALARQSPPESMIGTYAKPIETGSKGTVLAPDSAHYAVRRATELVQTLNHPASREAFVTAAWDREGAKQSTEEALQDVTGAAERVGEGATLLNVELGDGSEALARVVNRHGRKSTIVLTIEPAAPHRLYISGMMRELQEVTVEQATPKRVALDTDVVAAPLTFENGRPFVEVHVGDKGPYRFMVETGFDRIIFTPRLVAELGGRVRSLNDDTMFRIGETRMSSMVHVDELRIGGARLADFDANVSPKQPGVDGVLGLSTFANLLLTVDYPKQQLRLQQGALPEPDGREILPLRAFGPFVGIDLRIGGKIIPAAIDTQGSSVGGAGLSLTPELAPLVRFQSAPVEIGRALVGQRHESRMTMGRLAADMKVGRFTLKRPLVVVMTFGTTGHEEYANLGADFLRHFVMTLDQQNRRVRFTGSPAVIPRPPSFRSFGLSVQSSDGKVTTVREGTPAARAGVKVGDVLVSPKNLPALAKSGAPVKVELLRDGAPFTITLKSAVMVQ
jgi:predicted aspartyl protease